MAFRAKNIEALGHAQSRGEWLGGEDDGLANFRMDWYEIVMEGLRERLHRFRSLQIFMDICVRCGGLCWINAIFFIGSGDPQKYAGVAGRKLLRSGISP